jgi:hypothetical protein
MDEQRRAAGYLVVIFAALSLGGTCGKARPYHDVSGTWANASFGPSAALKSDDGASVDLDVSFTVKAAVPQDRKPLPVTGTLCIRDPSSAMSGAYEIDATASTWTGADYGGARLDIKARTPDGRAATISQAHMPNGSPDKLGSSIIVIETREGKTLRYPFEDFRRRTDVTCP